MAKGWKEIPPWVFCSDTGNPIDARNLERTWHRVRRRAQAQGVRPLRLHCARHTYATRALRAGKSLRWVAQQLGHANPELTLRTYAHVMPEEESDVSFANFGGSKRLYPAPSNLGTTPNNNTPGLNDRGHWEKLERETGFAGQPSWPSARDCVAANRRPSAWEAAPLRSPTSGVV